MLEFFDPQEKRLLSALCQPGEELSRVLSVLAFEDREVGGRGGAKKLEMKEKEEGMRSLAKILAPSINVKMEECARFS